MKHKTMFFFIKTLHVRKKWAIISNITAGWKGIVPWRSRPRGRSSGWAAFPPAAPSANRQRAWPDRRSRPLLLLRPYPPPQTASWRTSAYPGSSEEKNLPLTRYVVVYRVVSAPACCKVSPVFGSWPSTLSNGINVEVLRIFTSSEKSEIKNILKKIPRKN